MNGNNRGNSGGNSQEGGNEDPNVAMIKMMMNMGDLFKPTIMLSVAKRVRLINYTRYCEYFAEMPAMNTELNDATFDDFNNVVLLARYIKANFSKRYYELLVEYLHCLEFDFEKPMRTEKGTGTGKGTGIGKGRGLGLGSGPGLSLGSLPSISLIGGGNAPKEAYAEEYRQLAKFQFGFENPPPKPEGSSNGPNDPRCREGFMDKYLFYPYVKYKCKVKNPIIEKLPFKLDYFLVKNLVQFVAGLSEEFITKFIAFTSEPSNKNGNKNGNGKNGNKNKNKNKEPENLVENEGNTDREENATGIQERIYNFLDMINELSIFQLNHLIVIARTSFSVPIPPNIGGLKFKSIIMGLMIIFKPRGFGKIVKEKLSGAERDMLRLPLGENDIKETSLRLRLSRTLDPTTQANLIKRCVAGPLKSPEEVAQIIPESWRANPTRVVMILFMLQSFYLTHFPKQLDTDRLPMILPRLRFDTESGQSIIQYSGKPAKENGNGGGNGTSMNIPTKKKKIAEKSGVIYAQFIQGKAMITLFTKYILKYFYLLESGDNGVSQIRFWNLFIHLIRGLFSPTPETNFLDRAFDIQKFHESVITSKNLNNGSQIATQMDGLEAMIFGQGTGDDLITRIYEEVWKGDRAAAKRELLRMAENSPENFIAFFKKLFGRKYMMYVAEGNTNNIGKFGGIVSRINMRKPSFYSIHKLRLGSEEAARFNSLLLRTKWNANGNGNKNALNNYQVIKGKNREKRYNAETKKQLMGHMLNKMGNENQIAGNIKKNDPSFVWTEGIGPKMKEGLELEIFILLTYKKYLRNIFRVATARMDPLAVEVLAKV